MKRMVYIAARLTGIVAALALVIQLFGVPAAGAQTPPVTLTKSVCNLSTSGTTACTTGTTTATATAGNVLQYTITFTNNTANPTVTITDPLQTGQTYLSSQASTGGTCSLSGTTVTCTFTGQTAGSTGTAVIDTQVTGTYTPITNQATSGSAATQSACASGFTFNSTTGMCTAPIIFGSTECTGAGGAVSGTTCVGATETCPAAPSTNFGAGVPSTTASSYGTCYYPYTGSVTPPSATDTAACTAAHGTLVTGVPTGYFCTGVPATCSQTGFTPGGGTTGTSCTRPLQTTGIPAASCTTPAVVSANGTTCTTAPTCPTGYTMSGGTCTSSAAGAASDPTTVTVTSGTGTGGTGTGSGGTGTGGTGTGTGSGSGGNTTICGPVTAYTGGSFTISGVTFTVTNGTNFTGTPIVVGGNVCSNVTVNVYNQVISVYGYPNATGASFICANNGTGQQNCNLLSPTGVPYGNLSYLPIAASPEGLYGTYRNGNNFYN